MINTLMGKQRQLYWLVNVLLAACCLLFLVLTLMNWLHKPEIEVDDVPAVNAAVRPLAWRWFAGETSLGAAPGQPTEEVEALREASINASLIGVLISAQDAYATLRVNGREERVFRFGDEIENGVELVSIEPYRIIVEQRGRRMQVSMAKANNQMRSIPGTNANNNASDSGTAVQGFSLGDMVVAAPVAVEGYESGIKLDSLSGELSELAGLREGDIVVEVGGNSIQSLVGNPGQWASLGADSQLPVTIIRGGREQVIHVDASSLYSRVMPELGNQE